MISEEWQEWDDFLKKVNISKILPPSLFILHFSLYLCTRNQEDCLRKQQNGALAQLVEHRTENPCVPGSIPGGTTFLLSL